MTRGYVIIIDNTKEHNILKCAYQNSDSYLSGLGLEVLEAYEKKEMESFIDEKLKEYDDYKEDLDEIEWSWIDSSVGGEGFYNDYAYVYVAKTDELMIYYYGEFAFKFKRDSLEVVKFIFNNDGDIYTKMAFDINKREYEKDSFAHVRRILKNKMTIDDIQKAIDMPINSLYMESGRIVDSFSSDSFYKRVRDVDTDQEFKFFVKNASFYGEKKDIYLKTDFGNLLVKENATNQASAERIIKRFIKENYEEIMNIAKMFSLIEEYQERLNSYVFIKENYDIVDESSKEELEKTIDKIKVFKSSHLIFKKNNPTFGEARFREELEKRRREMLKSEDEKV